MSGNDEKRGHLLPCKECNPISTWSKFWSIDIGTVYDYTMIGWLECDDNILGVEVTARFVIMPSCKTDNIEAFINKINFFSCMECQRLIHIGTSEYNNLVLCIRQLWDERVLLSHM